MYLSETAQVLITILGVAFILVPLVPAILIYLLFPKKKDSKGSPSNQQERTIAAAAVFIGVIIIMLALFSSF